MSDEELEKIAYSPVESRRFLVSPDDVSRSRIRAMYETFKTLQTETPFPFAVTVFGSLSKGKELTPETAQAADIDFTLFIDFDLVQNNFQTWVDSNRVPEFSTLFQSYRSKRIAQPGIVQIIANMQSRVGVSDFDKQLYESIDYQSAWFAIQKVLSQLFRQKLISYVNEDKPPELHFFVRPIQFFGDYSIINLAFDVCYGVDNETTWDAELALARIFHLDVGGGMSKYIKHFIREISRLPDKESQKLWSVVVSNVNRIERNSLIPADMKGVLPSTIQEAQQYYLGRKWNKPPSESK